MNNPFDYIPDTECEEAFKRLVSSIETLRESDCPEDADFIRELDAGKMLGVLVAADKGGSRHTLYAFSGQLGQGEFHRKGFVGPVFDYLQPDGYFKKKEKEISLLSQEIALFERGELDRAREDLQQAREALNVEVAEYREICRKSKLERDARRKAGMADESEAAAMVRQSQFEKAELQRLKKRAAAKLAPYERRLNEALLSLDALKSKRHSESEGLQQWLFSNFRLLNAYGESKSVGEIFAETPFRVPPSGAGECCAPKLLQAAYLCGLQPVAMAEYWYGRPKGGEVRIHGEHYPACRGKCLPVLGWMLQGLDVKPPLGSERQPNAAPVPKILYENDWFCVVDKPGGMLSVPGKGAALSVEEWLAGIYGAGRQVKMAHRLDQDTSGLIIAAFGKLSHKVLQSMFAMRQARKTYVAVLDGDYEALGVAREGRIELPLSPDWLDRPRQKIDLKEGKQAVTDYEFTGATGGRSRVMFRPLTGRTHQLRVHAASAMGLGMPITGDRLYGKDKRVSARLLLHAHKIEFTFPIDKRHYSFESPVPF